MSIICFICSAKQRKIRFHDDNERDSDEDEKDTRPKLKPAVSALQVKMLQIAGQEVPMVQEPVCMLCI